MKHRSISLKAFRCPETGRDIHYSIAHLRGRGGESSPSSNNDSSQINDDIIISSSAACWIFFYPAGPNRRLLEVVISRLAPEFQCDRDVVFLSLNRPGKGGSSSSPRFSSKNNNNKSSDEREYIQTACRDILTIIDYYQMPKVNLLYMCAGSTFAYSFAAQYSDRTTGYILGLSSWILRHDGNRKDDDDDCTIDYATPSNMNSTVHSLAMRGYFGPKSIVSSLAGGIVASAPSLFNIFPQVWVVDGFKKGLSNVEKIEFEKQFPNNDGIEFVNLMTWIYEDGDEGSGSVYVNIVTNENDASRESNDHNHKCVPSTNDGNAMDIAVCLSTQHDLGMEYNSSASKQKRVLLWHGENDKMVNVVGAEYLESMMRNATLSYVSEGTHQGTMFFFPRDVMLEINQISTLN